MNLRISLQTTQRLVAVIVGGAIATSSFGCNTILHELQPHRLMRWNMATDAPRHAAHMSVPPPTATTEQLFHIEGSTQTPGESESSDSRVEL